MSHKNTHRTGENRGDTNTLLLEGTNQPLIVEGQGESSLVGRLFHNCPLGFLSPSSEAAGQSQDTGLNGAQV